MQFNEENFCPNVIDKSTPLKKYLYCKKINNLCKMVTYFPNGQMTPIQDVKNIGCPYGYAIQGIVEEKKKEPKRERVTNKSNALDDISKETEIKQPKQKKKTNKRKKKTAKKES